MNKWVLFKSAHLDVAVVVSSMAAVPRVHKDSIEDHTSLDRPCSGT